MQMIGKRLFAARWVPSWLMELEKSLIVPSVVNWWDASGCLRRSLGRMILLTSTRPGLLTTIRVLLSLAASYGLLVHQMDVKTAFLNEELDEEIYMDQPE
ncbi:hypothetical protein U9M48_004592 [Paspalum notatum var. saurae]|uniref:Reverse transcriptase Ty1/copia-type domain-containing protein n=1 Tax=Paspalum notatum var. saurae TaxID=547442 RepID=A0AAQ3SJ71_PASNO